MNTKSPQIRRSKIDMFSVLQSRNPHRQPDAWFGNVAIDPSAGKKATAPPRDKKGRKDLFQVIASVEASGAQDANGLIIALIDDDMCGTGHSVAA